MLRVFNSSSASSVESNTSGSQVAIKEEKTNELSQFESIVAKCRSESKKCKAIVETQGKMAIESIHRCNKIRNNVGSQLTDKDNLKWKLPEEALHGVAKSQQQSSGGASIKKRKGSGKKQSKALEEIDRLLRKEKSVECSQAEIEAKIDKELEEAEAQFKHLQQIESERLGLSKNNMGGQSSQNQSNNMTSTQLTFAPHLDINEKKQKELEVRRGKQSKIHRANGELRGQIDTGNRHLDYQRKKVAKIDSELNEIERNTEKCYSDIARYQDLKQEFLTRSNNLKERASKIIGSLDNEEKALNRAIAKEDKLEAYLICKNADRKMVEDNEEAEIRRKRNRPESGQIREAEEDYAKFKEEAWKRTSLKDLKSQEMLTKVLEKHEHKEKINFSYFTTVSRLSSDIEKLSHRVSSIKSDIHYLEGREKEVNDKKFKIKSEFEADKKMLEEKTKLLADQKKDYESILRRAQKVFIKSLICLEPELEDTNELLKKLNSERIRSLMGIIEQKLQNIRVFFEGMDLKFGDSKRDYQPQSRVYSHNSNNLLSLGSGRTNSGSLKERERTFFELMDAK
ncbi:MAG: Coiled-coil domain-containing protein 63, partial [Marteilia pararefringens]